MDHDEPIRWIVLGEAERSRLAKAAEQIFSQFEWVRVAYWYGSSVGARPARDIDIGLVAQPLQRAFGELETLADALAHASGLSPELLDLRIVNQADPVFLGAMLSGGVRLYEADRDERCRFEAQAVACWLDFRPAWERTRAAVQKRWAGANE